jgi:hypothetical protein
MVLIGQGPWGFIIFLPACSGSGLRGRGGVLLLQRLLPGFLLLPPLFQPDMAVSSDGFLGENLHKNQESMGLTWTVSSKGLLQAIFGPY